MSTMHFFVLATVILTAVAMATAEQSLPLRRKIGTGKSAPTPTSANSTRVTGFPQITPPVPASEVLTGRYTLTEVPDQCTDSFIPYQTTFWAQQNQMNMEDAVNPNWWGPKTPANWTFSTNTSGVFFSEPSWIVDGTNPALNLKPRTKANSFTLTMDETGKQCF